MAASQTDNAAVDNVVSRLIGLSGSYRECNQDLLSYFDGTIKDIANGILGASKGKEECELLMIARNCYQQATKHDGILHCARYFDTLNQFQRSKQCVEEYLVENVRQKSDHKNEDIERIGQMWVSFWSEIMRNCPGPILFDPLASSSFKNFDLHLDKTPRYLFRTFDPKSFGISNDDVVASPASEKRTADSKMDILCLDDDLALSIVDRHMNPWRYKTYGSHNPDNLMSWTSSLLYAIQYALYRRYRHGCASEDIKICVVDTANFPRGQFVHAKRLLQAYYLFLKRVDMRHYFDTRILMYIYQNGEYLS